MLETRQSVYAAEKFGGDKAIGDPVQLCPQQSAMDYLPDHFRTVELGTFDQAVCSPAAPSADWSGVQISAPQRITMAADEMPLRLEPGSYDLTVTYAGARSNTLRLDIVAR